MLSLIFLQRTLGGRECLFSLLEQNILKTRGDLEIPIRQVFRLSPPVLEDGCQRLLLYSIKFPVINERKYMPFTGGQARGKHFQRHFTGQ